MTALYKKKLHKEVYGQGDPVVMLHGWAMHSGVWREFAQALATEHQVVCLDLPGHGLSANMTPYTLESVVDAIHAQLPEQASVLLGWSLGGNIALRLAEKYPRKIKSLVLIACNPHFLKTESWPGVHPQILNEFAKNLQHKPVSTLLRFMSLQLQGGQGAKSVLKQIKAALQACPMPEPAVLVAGLAVLQTIDQRETLSRLKLPILMILGGQDSLVPESVGEACQLLQAQADVQIIPGAGHIPFITEQKQVLALLQDFMS